MEKQLILLSLLIIFSAGAMIMSLESCKKSTNANAPFIGTYTGSSNFGHGSVNDTVSISAGATASAITINEEYNMTTYTATVSGDSIIIPSQYTTLNTAGLNISSASGALTGTNLSLSANGQFSNSGGNLNFTFQGTRQ